MKYLGIDWGLKKIGLAVSEGKLASPHTTVKISSLKDGVNKICAMVENRQIEVVVVGKPEGRIGKVAERVAKMLHKMGTKVILADETLSTKEAFWVMIKSGAGRKRRREEDAVSAAVILQRYLDERK